MEAILSFPFRAAAVVSTGGGMHVYYCTRHDLKSDELVWCGDRLNGWFGRAKDVKAWETKPTIDLARTLRLPGALNFNAEGRVPVRLIQVDGATDPLERAVVKSFPTFMEAKRPVVAGGKPPMAPTAPRPRTTRAKTMRVFDGEAPCKQFNAAHFDKHAFTAFLERLGRM